MIKLNEMELLIRLVRVCEMMNKYIFIVIIYYFRNLLYNLV